MEKMQWFKFSISEWKMGKIQKCTPEAKSSFMELCCLYWINETKLSIEDAIIECDEDNYKNLLSKKVIKEVGGFIKIYFLDEQFENALEKSVKARESVEKRWSKRNTIVLGTNNDSNTTVLRQNYDSNTEEKRKEEIYTPSSFDFKKSLLSLGFDSNLVSEWLKVRKSKRLTNTETALNKFIKQVELTGLDKNLVLEKCVEKSWGGFESSWMTNVSVQQSNNQSNVLGTTADGEVVTDQYVYSVYKQMGKL
jgi:hypothetical protein